ncbi:hypothetical protein [Glacieibacterium sp.]
MTNLSAAFARTIIGVAGALFLASGFIVAATGPAALAAAPTSQVATQSA